MSARQLLSRMRSLGRAAWYTLRFAGRNIRVDRTSMVSRRSVLRTIGGGSIRVGAHCEIHDFSMILTYGGQIEIGDHCSLNPFSIVYGHGGVRMGRGVRIAAHSVIIPANHIRGDGDSPAYLKGVRSRGIDIGDDVWIAAGCRILDGVTIGPHSIIGAGSVVTRSVPANTTAVGVPARPLPVPQRSLGVSPDIHGA